MPELSALIYYRGVLVPNVGEPNGELILPLERRVRIDFAARTILTSSGTAETTVSLTDKKLKVLTDLLKDLKSIENTYQKAMDSAGGVFEAETIQVFYKDVALVPTYPAKFYYLDIQPSRIYQKDEPYKTKLKVTRATGVFKSLAE